VQPHIGWATSKARILGQAFTSTSKQFYALRLPLFVAVVVMAGMATAVAGFLASRELDWVGIGLLTGLGVLAQFFKVNLYRQNTISVSVGIGFASALLVGIPGVVAVSFGVSLANYIQMRPPLYKEAFNWAVHVLAGTVPALAVTVLHLQIHVGYLPLLLPTVLVAALWYYGIESGLIAGAISISKGSNLLAVWREHFQWLAQHFIVLCFMGLFLAIAYSDYGPLGVVIFLLPVMMMRYTQKQYVERTERDVRELQRVNQEVAEANTTIQNLNEGLFVTLSRILDARDPYVGGHAAKVADYAVAIGVELNMQVERLEPLRQAGFLHDIGKIAISESVLHKPGKLTDEEYEYVKTHAALGGEFLAASSGLQHLASFVRHHQEHWDGNGYPDGLKGEEIPLESRILAVCDAVEAMASDRPYRKGMTLDKVMTEIQRCAGTQFDPRVAEAFIRVVESEEGIIINSAHEVAKAQEKGSSRSTMPKS
jgi:hypothetical protein